MIVQIELVSSNIYSPQAKNNPASAQSRDRIFYVVESKYFWTEYDTCHLLRCRCNSAWTLL